MIPKQLSTSILIAAMSYSTTPLVAHHSFGAEYDAQRPVTLTGVVTKVEWTNLRRDGVRVDWSISRA